MKLNKQYYEYKTTQQNKNSTKNHNIVMMMMMSHLSIHPSTHPWPQKCSFIGWGDLMHGADESDPSIAIAVRVVRPWDLH